MLAPCSPMAFAPTTIPSLLSSPRAFLRMQDDNVPPVFSELEDSEIQYRSPSPQNPNFSPTEFAMTLPGISGPLGFFDPAGFCSDENGADGAATQGKVMFYREVELKHCRIAMLAALGFPVAEQFHPLWGGAVDAPSFSAFQQTPLQAFWPVVVFGIALFETFSVFTFENPNVEGWAIRTDHELGALGNRRFDPLGLAPDDADEFKLMQTRELNNGRLAMIAIAGMVVQEGITGAKLF